MKKSIIVLATLAMMVVSLVACSSDPDADKTQISYANWNLGTESDTNLERLMVEEYNASQDEVKVNIDSSIDGDDYDGKVNTAASAGNLPDVFMISDIPTAYSNDWLLDINDMAAEDGEYAEITEVLRESSVVQDKTVVVPFAKHLHGYFVNLDLLDQLNLDVPTDGDISSFVKVIKDATNVQDGYVGTNSAQAMIEWYPGQVNPDYGWFTFADDEFHLDSNEMITGMNTVKDLVVNGYSYQDLPEDDRMSLSEGDVQNAFKAGQIAFNFAGSYAGNDLQQNTDFNFEFIGIPGNRNAMDADFLGISKTTEYAQESYDFAKYMSFGKDGFTKRMELAKEHDLELSTLPISDNEELNTEYWNTNTVPGIEKQNERLDNAMLEPVKIVPGYRDARFEASTGLKIDEEENANIWYVINASSLGEINYQDYAGQLQELSQRMYDEANASLSE